MPLAAFLRRRNNASYVMTYGDATGIRISGNHVNELNLNGEMVITGSTYHDGEHTITGVTYNAGNDETDITLDFGLPAPDTEDPAPSTARAASHRYEFLFFPAEDMTNNMTNRAIALNLPAKDSSDVAGGDGSGNLIIDLGWYQNTIRVVGYCIPIDASNYPDLTTITPSQNRGPLTGGTDDTENLGALVNEPIYISGDGFTPGDAPVSTTGGELRHALTDFVADQGATGEVTTRDVALGWSDWDGPTPDLTIGSTDFRMWEGVITNLNTRRIAGEPDQYFFSFDFTVGEF